MKIETEKVQLKTFQLSPQSEGGILLCPVTRRSYQLNPLQYNYVDVLRNAGSIEGLVQFFLGQGWLVSFRELFGIVHFLVKEGFILNPSFKDYFANSSLQTHTEPGTHYVKSTPTLSPLDPSKLPFFRSLNPELASYLLQKADCIQAPQQTRLITAGHKERDLYILLEGQSAIYRVINEKQRQLISVMNPGAIFGERGFLLNTPRSADVITLQPSRFLRVQHRPEFDQLIRLEKAQSLQHRFWVLQALQSSSFFKNLPSDCLDSLLFSGRMCQSPANQILFREGQPGNTCFILIQGNVVVSKSGKNINVLGQGSTFGEISLLMSGGVRTATVTTQQDSVLLEIHQNDFYRVLSQNLFLAKEIETLAAQRVSNDAQRPR